MFETSFKVDTAGMENDRMAVAERLREIADQLEHGGIVGANVRDVNGILIGKWSVTWNHPEPEDNDDAWNDTDRYFDDDDNEVEYAVKWSESDQEWYEADKVRWNSHRGDYEYVDSRPRR